MAKIRLDTNVYDEAVKRIQFTFDNFDKIYLSFSGGKDSTVMLHMVMAEAVKRNREIAVMIVDLALNRDAIIAIFFELNLILSCISLLYGKCSLFIFPYTKSTRK